MREKIVIVCAAIVPVLAGSAIAETPLEAMRKGQSYYRDYNSRNAEIESLRQQQEQMRQQYDLDRQRLYNEQMQQQQQNERQQQEQGAAGYDSPCGEYYTGSAAGDNLAAAMSSLGGGRAEYEAKRAAWAVRCANLAHQQKEQERLDYEQQRATYDKARQEYRQEFREGTIKACRNVPIPGESLEECVSRYMKMLK